MSLASTTRVQRQNAISVDVEDYFQTEAMSTVAPRECWESFNPRVYANTHALLELFEAHSVRATFFFLGWVAERFPQLVRETSVRGHELGCHGNWHHPVFRLSPAQFREDTYRAKCLIEDAAQVAVHGFRAPNFSITPSCQWAYEILEDTGFVYDSSVYPVHHAMYGNHRARRDPHFVGGLLEIPVATWRVWGRNIPVAGGAYLRILPYTLMKSGIRSMNRQEDLPAVIYLHPWEIDEGQPRLDASWKSQLRQYTGLSEMKSKLTRLVSDFAFGTIYDSVYLPTVAGIQRGSAAAVMKAS